MPKGRLALLAGGGIGLLAGLNAALLRLGLPAPVESQGLSGLHGILMLYGFLGTAITLERAVALRSDKKSITWWGYLAPAFSGLAAGTAIVGVANPHTPFAHFIPGALWTASMAVLCLIYVVVWRKQPTFFVLVQTLGAIAGLLGVVLWWRGFEIPVVVIWWTAFLLLTIVGERLELARIVFSSNALQVRIFIEVLAYFISLTVATLAPEAGYPLMGVTLAFLIIDVGSHDIAFQTVRTSGLTKFMGAAMLAGYAWALVAAGIWVAVGPVFSGYAYDTSVHALTIGFALSMVMAHAPIIVPAVVRRQVPYSPVLWVVWGLLQVGLVVRVVGGARAAFGFDQGVLAWQYGGAVDVLTVLAFVGTTVSLILLASKARGRTRGRGPTTGSGSESGPKTGQKRAPEPEPASQPELASGVSPDGAAT